MMKRQWICGLFLLHGIAILSVILLLSSFSNAQEGIDVVKQLDQHAQSSALINRRAKFPEILDKRSDEVTDDLMRDLPEGTMASGEGLSDAFMTSLSIILVSEIGDETFIIAALMAMRHPRSIVLSGALSALIIMTVLSTGLGRIVPNLISRKHTNAAATVLYTFFGARLLYIAWRADPGNSAQKELEEVEEKLEGGSQRKSNFRRFLGRILTPIFLEAFILTFLAEWGDRSQIATIAVSGCTLASLFSVAIALWFKAWLDHYMQLASHKNAIGVTVGAAIGHTVCTSLAVFGGRLLALRISQRTVATIGGVLFLCFAVSSYIFPPL